MAVLKASTIEGNLDVGDGTTGAITCNGTMTVESTLKTKGDLTVGDGVTAALKANGDFATSGALTISGGSPAQYRICRQQSGTAGLVEWIDFAVYDTNGSTRLF
jgi:hypothetical protein